jgi:ssDNA-binding replication factor A large subunit
MKVNELEPNKKVVNLIGELLVLDEATTSTTGVKVQEGVLQDSTGQVKIVFWDADAEKYKKGEKIVMSTGWCKSFENELQISAGKFGKILKYTEPEPKN